MADILMTNDDGHDSVGFLPLLKELSKEFTVTAVAPSEQRSWVGKSISFHNEIVLKKIKIGEYDGYSCSGTPADCVQIGLYDVLERKPGLVVSGINLGNNAGHGRILSSGTVGAAMEASIDGVKAVSASLHIPDDIKDKTDFYDPKNYKMFENAARIMLKAIKIVSDMDFGDGIDLVSINIPFDATEDSGFEITRPFRDPYGKLFERKGDSFVHTNPSIEFKNLKKETDLKALSEGKISITPISLELVSDGSMEKLRAIVDKEW